MSQNVQMSKPEKVSEIQALTRESDRLSRALDSSNAWYVWFGAAALIVAFLVFFAQWRIIKKGKELSLVQSDLIAAKDRQAALDSKDQDERIAAAQQKAAASNEAAGHANERAGDLEKSNLILQGQVASLENATVEAKTAQKRVELDLAKQQERAAKAEAQLLEIAKRQQDRFVLGNTIEKALKGKPTGSITIWYPANDREAYNFAFSIMAELLGSGWKTAQPQPVPDNISLVDFLGPEFQKDREAIDRYGATMPPIARITGGNGELTLLSNTAPDKDHPERLVNILTGALKPLVQNNWAWRLASTLPDDTFILVVAQKP